MRSLISNILIESIKKVEFVADHSEEKQYNNLIAACELNSGEEVKRTMQPLASKCHQIYYPMSNPSGRAAVRNPCLEMTDYFTRRVVT